MADSTTVASDSASATGHNEKPLPIATPPAPAPPPPPMNNDNVLSTSLQDRPQLPPIPTMPSLGPMTPVSPTGPPDSAASLPSPVEKTRKSSHLVDLIESEKSYVDLLTGVIRKVAAAWSRSNLPPPELDVMFRSVEAVYKANRMLLAKLKEIGENPSSPKALGDLLMRWIDDLDRPYTTYADKYCAGFDDWKPVMSNHKLSGILEAFSVANPLPSSIILAAKASTSAIWTLDALFSLPKGRLQYYRKLYSRLLRSTTPGRSDHRLLTGALEKLDDLLATIESRAHIRVGEEALPSPPSPASEEMRNVETDTTDPADGFAKNNVLLSGQFGTGSESAATSLRGSSSSSGERYSRETESTSISRDSSQINSLSVTDLERRLVTDNTLDIFTMEPKQVRLQMAPPTLPYARELRASVKVVIRFTPKSTGAEVVHHHGHIYILSDLFLVCEEIRPGERDAGSVGGPDMRLCYPPLSGKVLKVFEVPGQVTAVQVSIMRKETLILVADSQQTRDDIIKEFHECISFAKTMSAVTQEPVPPLPKMGLPNSPIANLKPSDSVPRRERPERPIRSVSDANTDLPEGLQSSLDSNGAILPLRQSSAFDLPRVVSPQYGSIEWQQMNTNQYGFHKGSRSSVQSTPSSGRASAEDRTAHGVERAAHQPQSSYPLRKSSVGQGATHTLSSSFMPGQIIPPVRSTSMQSSHPMRSSDSDTPTRIYSPPAGQQPSLHHHSSIHSLRHQPLSQPPSPFPSLYHGPSIHQNLPPPHVPSQQVSATYLGAQSPQHLSRGSALPTPVRPPSEPSWSVGRLQKSLSSRSLHLQYEYGHPHSHPPPVPSLSGGLPQRTYGQHQDSSQPLSRPVLPSMQMGSRANSYANISVLDPSPPTSPVEEPKPVGPVRSTISAQMKCKVFHQQQHAQWKSLGSAKLTLYRQEPTNVKQLVVEADTKDKAILISTIVLTDGVERVGKTGVAIELSDAKGARTGIIYMIQLRNETSAGGLFETLLAGSDRSSK